ncbi:MAG: amidohydrolase family protein [Promethearchaeota archaeon]
MKNYSFNFSDFRYIDSHVHFFPEQLFQAIWDYWKREYLPLYPTWHNKYEWHNNELIEFLKKNRIEHYTTLNYAHRKGIAEGLNEWTRNFCLKNPSAIPFGTAHPDDYNILDYTKKAIVDYNFLGFKFQLMVTDFYIHDNRLIPFYKLLQELDKILYVHAGTAPSVNQNPPPGAKVGVKYFLKYLNQFPDNKVIVAHMGGYEYEEFFKIVENYSNVYLDTTMIFITPDIHIFPEEDNPARFVGESRLLSFIEENNDKILFGSDFPNIPYDYIESINGLLSLNLSKKTYKKIFYENAKKLFILRGF